MPTFPAAAHRFGDLTVSVGTDESDGADSATSVQIRVAWKRRGRDLGSALFALALDSEVGTYRILVPTGRVAAASSTRFSLRPLPIEERRAGVEPLFRQVAVTGLPPEYAFARRARPRIDDAVDDEAPPYQRAATAAAAAAALEELRQAFDAASEADRAAREAAGSGPRSSGGCVLTGVEIVAPRGTAAAEDR
jgi:hypothetical protein